jgi:hypothetical protein
MPKYGETKKRIENGPPQDPIAMRDACRMLNIAFGGIERAPKRK